MASHSSPGAYYLLAPSLILVAAVAVYPVGSGVWLSFQRYNLLRAPVPSFTGLTQYQDLWTDPVFWTAFRDGSLEQDDLRLYSDRIRPYLELKRGYEEQLQELGCQYDLLRRRAERLARS